MATSKAKRLMLDCDICGEPVYVRRHRYVELVRTGRLPRCRKNGCEQLCGAPNPVPARTPELIAACDVPLRRMLWPRAKRGNRNGALAKMRVILDQEWRYDSAVPVAE